MEENIIIGLNIMSSKNDRWSALSMKERADFIKRAVEEGITERKSIIDTFNSLAEGGDTNSTESVPRSLMSKDEYLNSKRQEIIDKSLENSNNRTLPAVPYVTSDIDEDIWRETKETLLKEFQDKLGNLPETHRDRATIVDTISKLQQELNAGPPSCVPGASCIYTATDNYGTKYRVSGNQSFRANPSKYGFTEVGLNEIAPGDIIQDFGDKNIPIHALTFMGYDKDNEALFNYSRGGADKKDIRKNAGYYLYSSEDLDYNPLNSINNDKFKHTAAAYRFVGTEDDNKQWENEYIDYRQSYDKDWLEMAKKVQNITPTPLLETPQSTIITTSTKANGGRILDGKTEENQTVSNTPWYQQNIHPLSSLGQAINDANTNFNYKYSEIPKEELNQQLSKKEAGLVTELIDKNGKAVFVPKGQSITPLEASIAEWLPGTGDIAEIGQITNDLDNSDYLSAAIGAGLLFLPGNVGKLWKKGKEALGLTKKASKTVRDPNLVTETINTINPNAEVADSPRRLTREAKITEAERQGIPKSERNNVTQKRSDVPKEIIDKHKYITFDSPKVDKKLLTKAKEGYESDSPIKSFASKLTDLEIHPMFKNYIDGDEVFENPVITQYRYYLEKQGIDPDMFSSDELSKILSYNLNEIQNSATGALKDNILWHSTSKDFDAFDFEHHLGDNTRNSGIFGAGNYFSTKYPQNYGVYAQPFIVSDIDALVDYSDIKGWKTKGIFDKKDIPKGLAVSGNNTGPQAATGFGNYIEELDPYYNQFEISVPKNSGIKSIFPHPSRFIVDDSGNISLLPVNWEDVRFNYGNGGKINKFGPGGDTKGDEKIPFLKRLLESGQSARDARVGAIGAQQVRDLYSEGKTEEAQKLAEQYAKANTTGIALASGAATSSLLGDLAVTGATTAADTLIDGDINNFGKNFLFNAAADILGHGAGKAVNKVAKTIKATKVARDPNLVTDVVNTVDDVSLDPYSIAEVPERAFLPKEKEIIKLSPTKVSKEKEKFVEDVVAGAHFARKGTPAEMPLKEFKELDGFLEGKEFITNGVESSVYKGDNIVYKVPVYEHATRIVRDPKTNEIVFTTLPEFKTVKDIVEDSKTYLNDLNKYWFQEPISLEGYFKVPKISGRYLPVYSQPKAIKSIDYNPTSEELKQYKYLTEKLPHSNIFSENDLPIPYDTNKGNFMVFPDGVLRAVDIHKYGGKINRFDIGGSTTSTEANTQVVEEPISSNPYKYSVLNIPYDRTAMLNRHKPFYVTDENGNFVKGADGKLIPSTLGNILKKQLQPLRDIEGKEYYVPTSFYFGDRGILFSGESNRGTQPTSTDADEFLFDWYNSPATIDIIKKEARANKTNVFQDIPYTDENGNTMMYSPTPEETVALRSKLASNVPEYKDVEMGKNIIAAYRPKSSITEAPSLNGEIFKVAQEKDGDDRYLGPYIHYGDNESKNSGSWVPLHEKNHAYQHQLLPSYFIDKDFEDVELKHDELKSEQHSYLMALRAALGLNPEKRDYTKEDAQQMIEALQNVGGGSAGPNKLLKVINNDAGKLAYMLNTWAAADDPEEVKKELTLKYSKGGRILDGKTKRMYGGNNDNFRSVAKMNARKLSSKTLK